MLSVCVVLLLMLGWSGATPQDMSGKMFTFPQESTTAYVKLTTERQSLDAVTVCLRAFTDLPRAHSLFSMATPTNHNEFVMFRRSPVDELDVNVKGNAMIFQGQVYERNKRQSVCSTWDSTSGLGQLWINGRGSTRKFATTSDLRGPFSIMLGQEQDSYGGGFEVSQSFVGMITDLHMWDYVLSPNQILAYSQKYVNYPAGNVLDWNSLDFQITGRVLIEGEQKLSQN